MKHTKLILLILCMSLMLSMLVSCSKEAPQNTAAVTESSEITTEAPKLTEEELIAKMIEDAEERWVYDLSAIIGPLGIFDDKIAIFMDPNFSQPAYKTVTIASFDFEFVDQNDNIYIYHNGTFTMLSKAYEENLISRENVEEIYGCYTQHSLEEYVIYDKYNKYGVKNN